MDRVVESIAAVEMLETCRAQLVELQSASAGVCETLRELSRDLLEGRPPATDRLDRLSRFRADYEHLLLQVSTTFLGPADADLHDILTLPGLQDGLETCELIRATLARLDTFDRIQHVEQVELVAWQLCRADGTRLRQELLAAPARQARSVAERFMTQSPLNAIVTLVTDGNQLCDERWSVLLDTVSTAYGREVSTAIARGKMTLTPGSRA
jgi:hypothetical protein